RVRRADGSGGARPGGRGLPGNPADAGVMTETDVLDILRQGLWTALVVSTPILAVALIVGLAIGLVQALTSVQAMTLTFVPKLGAILIVFWASMSFSGQTLVRFYQDKIIPMVIGRGASGLGRSAGRDETL